MQHCSFIFICTVVFNTLIISKCCPSNCVMCLNAVSVCNKYNSEQKHSGKYDIGLINSGAFINADFVTLLELSSSSVTSIEDGAFQGLDSLIILDLSQNSLTTLQDNVFLNMPSLEVLDLSSNTINTIQVDAFEGLETLKRLDLSDNQISSLPDGVFTPLLNLQTLDLSNNEIDSLNSDTFTGLGNLTNLILSDNSLKSVSDMFLFSKLPSLKQISISNNQWHCDCNITNVIHFMEGIITLDNSTLTCSTPSSLANVLITDLNLYEDPLACYEAITPSPSPSLLPPSPSPSYLVSPPLPFISPSPSIEVVAPSPSLTVIPPTSYYTTTTTTIASTSSSSIIIPSTSSFSSHSTTTTAKFFTTSSLTMRTSSSSSSPSISSSSNIPSLLPLPSCLNEKVETAIGITEWEDTVVEDIAHYPCPFGPEGNTAIRVCLRTPNNEAAWGEIQTGGCLQSKNYLQLLLNQLNADNAFETSSMLLLLPFNHLTQDDISLLVDILHSVMALASGDKPTLLNVFVAIDLALEGSQGNPLSTDSSKLLRSTINAALFNVSSPNTHETIYDLNNFFLGGKNVENNTQVEALATLSGEDAGLQFVKNGTESSSRDHLSIKYDKEGALYVHMLQITVYTNNTLYTEGCVEGVSLCDAMVVSPVTVVATDVGDVGSVNVTFDISSNETESLCAVWNASSNGGIGEWEVSLCQTNLLLSSMKILCECNIIGAVALIQVPEEAPCTKDCSHNTTSEGVTVPLALRLSFTIACGISVLLHLVVVVMSIAVCCKYEFVRNIQALLNQGIAQSLLFIALAVSLGNDYAYEVCLGLGSLVHYLIMVSFMWLLIRPVVLLFSLIQRNFYERDYFILPFIFIAWAIPIIPIAVYGVITFTSSDFREDLQNSCWLDSFIFPGYFLYLSLACVSIVILSAMVILSFMAMSSYTISRPGYAQLFQVLVETVLLSIVVGMYFGSAIVKSDGLVIATAGVIVLNGVYFFGSNGPARMKIRNAMICKDDKFHGGTVYKNPLTTITNPSSISSSFSSNPTNVTTIPPKLMFRAGVQRMSRNNNPSYNDFAMDYITDYIPHQYRYPLNMWDQVKDGKKVRKPKKSTSDNVIKGGGRGAIEVGLGSSEV